MPGAGWSNAASPGFSGAGACWSAGSSILKTFSVSFNSLAYLSSSGNFEIGSSEGEHAKDRNYIIKAYVFGDYLDGNVSLERGAFNFEKDNDLVYGISQSQIEA